MTRRPPGFTMLELTAAIVVLSVIAAVILPVMVTTLQHYGEAVTARRSTERAAFAIDRTVRFAREIPVDDAGVCELTVFDADTITQADGQGIELSVDQLLLRDDVGVAHVLCKGVEEFELTYLGADGVTATADAGELWRVNVRLVVDGEELAASAFIRARVGGG